MFPKNNGTTLGCQSNILDYKLWTNSRSWTSSLLMSSLMRCYHWLSWRGLLVGYSWSFVWYWFFWHKCVLHSIPCFNYWEVHSSSAPTFAWKPLHSHSPPCFCRLKSFTLHLALVSQVFLGSNCLHLLRKSGHRTLLNSQYLAFCEAFVFIWPIFDRWPTSSASKAMRIRKLEGKTYLISFTFKHF